MKRFLRGSALVCLLLLAALIFAATTASRHVQAQPYYQTKNYQVPGGADWEVGGILNLRTGGKITVNGVDKTAALGSVARMAQGETALGGTNPTAVTTGLTSITSCIATIKITTAPGVGTTTITYGSSGGTLNLYGWKPTSNANPTLIASTGTETVGWVCFGT